MQDDFEPDASGRDPYDRTPSRRDTFGRPQGSTTLVRILLVVGSIVAVRIVMALVACSPEQRAERLAQDYDAEMMANPQARPGVVRMQTSFPGEYNQLKAKVVAATRAGASRQEIDIVTAGFMARFMKMHSDDLAHAPTADLKAIREARLDLYLALQAVSTEQCAELFRTGSLLGHVKSLDRDSLAIVGRLSVINLDAIVAGHDHPVARSPLTTSEHAAVAREFRRTGLSQSQLVTIADTRKLMALPSRDQCNMAVKAATAMNQLPPALADGAFVESLQSQN